MAELEKILCTDSRVEAVKKINAIIEQGGGGGGLDDKITNCITEIPQRIKLELKGGTLTLKAGSVVIIPNGFEADGITPKFDYVTIDRDVYRENWGGWNRTDLIWMRCDEAYTYTTLPPVYCHSGETAPTTFISNNAFWYDTKNNICKLTTDKGATWQTNRYSLPFGIITFGTSGNGVKSIDQVFNGIGYIGSTIWVDKGVKGLIPNGRNADGSLKNIEYIENNLRVYTISSTVTANYVVAIRTDRTSLQLQQTKNYYYVDGENDLPNAGTSSSKAYVSSENSWYYLHSDTNYTWQKCEQFVLGETIWENGVVTSFQSKLPFRAVDVNEMQEVQCVVETYKNETSGYRIWSDGYCEQWGTRASLGEDKSLTVTLLKPFISTDYLVFEQSMTASVSSGSVRAGCRLGTRTTTTFVLNQDTYSDAGGLWQACGYIK